MSRNEPAQEKAPARKRRGFPFIPTLILLIAVPGMIAAGIWQLQRMQWKEALLSDLRTASELPLTDLETAPIPDGFGFRKVRLALECGAQEPRLQAGRNNRGQSGYTAIVECSAGGEPLLVNMGWLSRPEILPSISAPALSGDIEGVLVEMTASSAQWMLYPFSALPPLEPAAAPTAETMPNNHLSYAMQWFGFAAILSLIYALYVRSWRLASLRRAS